MRVLKKNTKEPKKPKKIMKFIKILLLIAIIGGLGFVYVKYFGFNRGIRITAWNNKYNENNITFFYEEPISEKISNVQSSNASIQSLESVYKIKSQISSGKSEIETALEAGNVLHSLADYGDVDETTKNNAFDIIREMGGRKKLSSRDMAVVQRDILIDIGVKARIGEFKKENPQFQKKSSYYVIEFWSIKYNKWIMLDCEDVGYFERDNVPQSVMEIIEANQNDLTYIGKSAQIAHKDTIKPFLSSYTVAVDNTLAKDKSNIYLTYCSSKKDLDLKKGSKYIGTTIFTDNRVLFEKPPTDTIKGTDYKSYILLTKKTEDSSAGYSYTITAYKDGTALSEFYLNVNDDPIEKVFGSKEIDIEKGTTKIELLVDGQKVDSSVTIIRDK